MESAQNERKKSKTEKGGKKEKRKTGKRDKRPAGHPPQKNQKLEIPKTRKPKIKEKLGAFFFHFFRDVSNVRKLDKLTKNTKADEADEADDGAAKRACRTPGMARGVAGNNRQVPAGYRAVPRARGLPLDTRAAR